MIQAFSENVISRWQAARVRGTKRVTLMNPIFYAIGALLFFGWADFIFKRAADAGIRSHHFILLQVTFFAPSVIALAYFSGAMVWDVHALWGCLAGLFIFVGLYNFSRSLAAGSVSINAPLFRMNFMVTVMLAVVFLGEALTVNRLAGLAAAAVAVWLLVAGAVRGGAEAVPGRRRSLLQALLATVAFGAGNFCHKLGLSHGVAPLTMLVAQISVFATLSVASCVAIDRGFKFPLSSQWRTGVYIAAVMFVAFMCMLRGFATGEASIVAPIAQMGFIVTATLGIVLLHERFTVRKGLGLAAAVAALAAFAL
jgi:drug/metabolite transporter (DMT)-like permease